MRSRSVFVRGALVGLWSAVVLSAGAAQARAASGPSAAGVEFFEKNIRPLLIEHCYECHSAERGKTKGGLALDTRAGWEKGGGDGPAIVPGDLENSPLIAAVRRVDRDTAMPPKKPLPDHAVALLEKWVAMGAPDPRDGTVVNPAKALADNLWCLQPVKRPPVPVMAPTPAARDWPRTEVDAFLLAKLEAMRLAPSPDAPAEAFARRLWFVLVGLPPTPEQLAAFTADMRDPARRDAALATWVDRLIASPQFGEKWARHWLDVARYAETNGKALNNGLPYSWRYRDWVIRAFNEDKPFDRFLTEQLAGDLLPAANQDERDALAIATGFLAIGSKEHFGGCGNRSVAEVEPEWVDDQLNVLGRGLLGLTVSCSRCHDHKFDPVPMRDYYALSGIFYSTEILSGRKGGATPEFGVKRIYDPDLVILRDPSVAERLEPIEKEFQAIQKKLSPLRRKATVAGDGPEREKLRAEIAPLEARAEALRKDLPEVEYAFGVREDDKIGDTTLRKAGVWNAHGEVVPRGFLSAIKHPAPPAIPANSSGRLELARWLTDPEHPLTARVYVNRVWHHVFGQGIVPTTDNFGVNGSTPSHPELLDFLAARFVREQRWSTKALVRDLVLSRAFRQTSAPASESKQAFEADPANRYLWRMNTRCLEAEAIRDAILLSAGRLDFAPRTGTSPLLMEHLFKGIGQKVIDQIRAQEALLTKRAVYLTIIRNDTLDATLAAFDFPNNDEPVTHCDAATVPAQALFLMNNPLVIESARHLAGELERTTPDPAARVRLAFLRTLGREPAADEASDAEVFLGSSPLSFPLLCQALYQSAEFRLLP